MNDTEELIKAALAKGADRAPHPGQIINALAKPRRRRRSVLIAVIGAAVVVAAATVPIAFRQSAEPVPPAPPATTQLTPPPAAVAIPMKYTVADIPPDFVEVIRNADFDGGRQSRGWSTAKDWTINLAVHTPRSPGWSSVTRKGAEQILVGGAPGWVTGPPTGFVDVVFMPDQDTAIVVQASGGPDIRERAIKAANSVRPDGVTVVGSELSFGTLPTRLSRVALSTRGSSPATGEAWIVALAADADPTLLAVEARIVPKNTTRLNGWNVVVPTRDGREIELKYGGSSQLTEQQAREVAEGMTVGAKPDLSWLGK
jgi:hypothetical protein